MSDMKLFETDEEQISRLVSLRVESELQKIASDPKNIIKAYERLVKTQSLQIEMMQPKSDAFDIMLSSSMLTEMKKIAKTLNYKGMGRNNLFAYLRHKNILMFDNEPYQIHVDNEYFKSVAQTYFAKGESKINYKTMTTAKGLNFINNLLKEDGYKLNDK